MQYQNLKIFKTNNNLGGAITGTQVTVGTPNNVFTNVPNNERVLGEDYFACVYFKNTDSNETMKNVKIWLSAKSFPHDTILPWGYNEDPPVVATTCQTIANKYA